MARLNGWKRIGIIVSVAWIFSAGIFVYNKEDFLYAYQVVAAVPACKALDAAGGDAYVSPSDECKQGKVDFLNAFNDRVLEVAAATFIPVPLGWGVAYLILFLVNWVRRGFNAVRR